MASGCERTTLISVLGRSAGLPRGGLTEHEYEPGVMRRPEAAQNWRTRRSSARLPTESSACALESRFSWVTTSYGLKPYRVKSRLWSERLRVRVRSSRSKLLPKNW